MVGEGADDDGAEVDDGPGGRRERARRYVDLTMATVQRRGRELGRRLCEKPFDTEVLAELTVFLEDTIPVLTAVAPPPAVLPAAAPVGPRGVDFGPVWSPRRSAPVRELRVLPGGVGR